MLIPHGIALHGDQTLAEVRQRGDKRKKNQRRDHIEQRMGVGNVAGNVLRNGGKGIACCDLVDQVEEDRDPGVSPADVEGR